MDSKYHFIQTRRFLGINSLPEDNGLPEVAERCDQKLQSDVIKRSEAHRK